MLLSMLLGPEQPLRTELLRLQPERMSTVLSLLATSKDVRATMLLAHDGDAKTHVPDDIADALFCRFGRPGVARVRSAVGDIPKVERPQTPLVYRAIALALDWLACSTESVHSTFCRQNRCFFYYETSRSFPPLVAPPVVTFAMFLRLLRVDRSMRQCLLGGMHDTPPIRWWRWLRRLRVHSADTLELVRYRDVLLLRDARYRPTDWYASDVITSETPRCQECLWNRDDDQLYRVFFRRRRTIDDTADGSNDEASAVDLVQQSSSSDPPLATPEQHRFMQMMTCMPRHLRYLCQSCVHGGRITGFRDMLNSAGVRRVVRSHCQNLPAGAAVNEAALYRSMQNMPSITLDHVGNPVFSSRYALKYRSDVERVVRAWCDAAMARAALRLAANEHSNDGDTSTSAPGHVVCCKRTLPW